MKPQEPLGRMRRKIDREDGFQEGEVIETWSKKRIGIAALLAFLVIGGVGYGMLSWTEGLISKPLEKVNVLGESSSDDEVKLPTREDIEKTLENAKNELEKISSENVTASDAAVQRVIQDLQSIQGGGKEPKDVICELVCKQ